MGQQPRPRREPADGRLAEELAPPLRPDAQEVLYEVERIGPVVAPISLAEDRVHALLRAGDELLKAPVPALGGQGIPELARALLLPVHDEGLWVYLQRIVAVQLYERAEGPDVVLFHEGRVGHVAAPVLIHIPEVAVALREGLGREVEVVVVPLEVAVLAREGVEHLRAKLHRPAAAQAVVQEALAAIGVEGRVSGPGTGPVRQFERKRLGPLEPFCEPVRAEVRRYEGI